MPKIPAASVGATSPAIERMKKLGLRVAILHSGGPAPGGNRVLAGAAKQFLDRGVPVLGFHNGYEFIQDLAAESLVCGTHYVEITRKTASQAIDANAFILRTSRANPGRLLQCPRDMQDAVKVQKIVHILDIFEKMKIGVLISIGGDDTLKTANYLYETARGKMGNDAGRIFQGAVIHVPKTIDNDYYGISWTFGYFTAAESAGRVVRGLYDDAKATNSYHVVELMGRKAGWYTAAASIFARGTRAIIPEDYENRPFVLGELSEQLFQIVARREENGKGYGVFCIAEGLADRLSDEEKSHMEKDRHGNLRLSEARIGERLSRLLTGLYKQKTGREKSFKHQLVGYETRQNPPSLYDVLLTSQLGVGAYRLFEQGRFGEMVTVRDNLEIDGIPFSALIDPQTLLVKNRSIDTGGDFYNLLRSLEEKFSR